MSNPPATPETSSSAPRGRHVPVAKLRKGDRVHEQVFLVEEANFKQTRNSKYFIQLILRDQSGSVKAVRWEATRELFASLSGQDFLSVDGRVEEFQGQLQVVIDELQAVAPEEIDLDDFLPKAARPIEEMERDLLREIDSFSNAHLQRLVLSFLEDPALRDQILRCPAGKSIHHAYLGGLLEHTLSLMKVVRRIKEVYGGLDLDLLLAVAFLHDIGKVRELSFARAFHYTDEGQLVGHIGIGIALVAEKARQIPGFPPDLLHHIQHIIASHHGLPEHGALKPPMTPEAIVFHFLDNLDAKMAMLEDVRGELELADRATEQSRRWTEYKPALGRKLYFP